MKTNSCHQGYLKSFSKTMLKLTISWNFFPKMPSSKYLLIHLCLFTSRKCTGLHFFSNRLHAFLHHFCHRGQNHQMVHLPIICEQKGNFVRYVSIYKEINISLSFYIVSYAMMHVRFWTNFVISLQNASVLWYYLLTMYKVG